MIKKLTIVISIILYLGTPVLKEKLDNKLYIYVLDIGQGDATLIKTPEGKIILIDTGDSNYILSELGEVLPYWQRKIDLLILTHPHSDHINATKDLIDRYKVQKIVWFNVKYESAISNWIEGYARSNPAVFSEIFRGNEITIDSVSMKFLFPEEGNKREIPNVNNASVSFLLKYKDFTALFTGDAEEDLEQFLIELLKKSSAKITYFKAGHHCSDTSNSEELLKIIRPSITTCSVGKNNQFGHPKTKVLNRFKSMGIKYFRTDKQGRIEMSTNGSIYDVQSER